MWKYDTSAVEQYQEMLVRYWSELVGKVERSARGPWVTQEMIIKMDERRK
jgi:hypothetical protein